MSGSFGGADEGFPARNCWRCIDPGRRGRGSVPDKTVDAAPRRRARAAAPITAEDQLREALAAVLCEEMLNVGDGAPEARHAPVRRACSSASTASARRRPAAKLAHRLSGEGKQVPVRRGGYVPRRRCGSACDMGRNAPVWTSSASNEGGRPRRRGVRRGVGRQGARHAT